MIKHNAESIVSSNEIVKVHAMLKRHGNQDFADLWEFAINVPLRISELLAIQIDQINLKRGELELHEKKAKKKGMIRIPESALAIIQRRRAAYPLDKFLFQSHDDGRSSLVGPMYATTVNQKFKEIGNLMDINITANSMRQTYSNWIYYAALPNESIAKFL